MPVRSAFAPLVILALAIVIACGGGDDSSTPTPSGSAPDLSTPDPNLGPADGVVIFASPDATERALRSVVDGDGPDLFYLGGQSRDENSFDGADLPGEALARGVRLAGSGSEAYNDVFGDAGGDASSGIRQGYDAVYVIALAAAAANSTDPAAVRDHITFVANSPGDVVNPRPEVFASVVDTLADGGDVNFIGASGQVDFTATGDAAKGRVDVWRLLGEQIIDQEIRDVDLAAEVGADVPSGQMIRSEDDPDGPLRIGAVLPLGTDEGSDVQEAMELALEEINDDGGLFGEPVELLFADSGDDAGQAASAAEDLEGQDVAAIIGPLDIEGAVAVAGAIDVPQIALTTSASLPLTEGGTVFRGMGGEVLETPTLANLAIEADVEVVCVIYEPGAANQALATAFRDAFEHKGGGVRQLVEVTADGVSEANVTSCLGT